MGQGRAYNRPRLACELAKVRWAEYCEVGLTQAVSSVYIVGFLYVLLRLQAHIASRYICLNWTLKERVKKGVVTLSDEARLPAIHNTT